jgi:hypothetical protein
MKIVDNRITAPVNTPLEAGEVLIGSWSGKHYIVLSDLKSVLRVENLNVTSISSISYERTGIKKENISITFEGAKQ